MLYTFHKNKLRAAAKKIGLRFVILHGSRATGRAGSHSDIDIAVLGKKILTSRQQLKLFREFDECFPRDKKIDLDIKTMERADPLFRYEVTRDGVLLFGNTTDYENYKAASYHLYEDAKPLFELERILIKRGQKKLRALYA